MIARVLQILVICAAIIIVFHQILVTGFVCDDFLHLPYLLRAQTNPSLLWANFVGPWIGETNLYLFYRPLTEISLFIDWLMYGANPAGFHLTALILHMVNAILLTQIYIAIALNADKQITRAEAHLPAFFAALLWALDPLSCESLGWVMSRSDLVCTTFYLAAMLIFIKGKGAQNRVWVTTLLSLALLCKEMAVTLPAVLLLWLILVKKYRWRQALDSLWPMLAATLLYLICRAIALHDPIGGYVGSTGAMLRKSAILRWFGAGSIWHLFYPLSRETFAQQDPLRLLLKFVYGSIAVLICLTQRYSPKTAIFCMIWFILTLIPNWQNWLLDDTMCGARIAYLPTMGLYGALVFYLWPAFAHRHPWHRQAMCAVLASWATCYALASMTFIKTWQTAAAEMQKVQSDLAGLVKTLPTNHKLVALNLPYMYKAVFQANTRAEIKNLLEPPLYDSADPKCSRLTASIFTPDFTYLNSTHFPCETIDRLSQTSDHQIYLYDPITRAFSPLPKADLGPGQPINLHLSRQNQQDGIWYTTRLPRPMPVTSVLRLKYKLDSTPFSKIFFSGRASIFVSTPQGRSHLNERQRGGILIDLIADGKPHVRDIDLASYKCMRWQSDLSLLYLLTHAQNASLEISEAQLIPRAMAMPIFKPGRGFEGRVFEETTLAQTYDETVFPLTFDYDASKATDPIARLVCQISKPHCVFADAQTFDDDAVDATILLPDLKGQVTIDKDVLSRVLPRARPTSALRQVRILGMDKQNRLLKRSTAYTIAI